MRKILSMCLGVMLLCAIPMAAFAQGGKHSVKGTIVDQAGEPVIGAMVAEVGTTNGAITDIQGGFALNVKDQAAVLEISFIGYKTITKVANVTDFGRIVLEEDVMALDELVVIG